MILDQLPPNSKTYLHARGERMSHSISSKPSKSNKKSHLPGNSRFQPENSKNLKRQTETDHAEKVVFNTWFEGANDFVNLAGFERPLNGNYRNDKPLIDQREKIRDYEEILQDSPTNSFSQHHIGESVSDNELFELDKPESIEDLITNIDEIMKTSQALKKPSHKRGISHALGPKNSMQQKRLIHQSSMLMDSPDLDSIFNSFLEKTSSKKFDKLDTTRLTRNYSEQKNARSSLSTSLQRDDTGQVIFFKISLIEIRFENCQLNLGLARQRRKISRIIEYISSIASSHLISPSTLVSLSERLFAKSWIITLKVKVLILHS